MSSTPGRPALFLGILVAMLSVPAIGRAQDDGAQDPTATPPQNATTQGTPHDPNITTANAPDSTSTAVSALPAPQIAGHVVEVEWETGGNAFEDHHERPTVRFAGGQKSHHQRLIVYEVSAPSAGRQR